MQRKLLVVLVVLAFLLVGLSIVLPVVRENVFFLVDFFPAAYLFGTIGLFMKYRTRKVLWISVFISFLGFTAMGFEKTGPVSPLLGLGLTILISLPWLAPWFFMERFERVLGSWFLKFVVASYVVAYLSVVAYLWLFQYPSAHLLFILWLSYAWTGLLGFVLLLLLLAFAALLKKFSNRSGSSRS